MSALRLAGNYQLQLRQGIAAPVRDVRGRHIPCEGFSTRWRRGGATALTFGGGFGVGFPVSDMAGGSVEARMDKLDHADDGGVTVIGEATVIQIGAGFDLWFQ